jgi:copper chaperone CopZ
LAPWLETPLHPSRAAIINQTGEIMPEFTLRIEGMHCGACVRRVSQALAGTEGLLVKEVRIGAARISSAHEPLPVERALAALAKAGYPAHLDPDTESISSQAGH